MAIDTRYLTGFEHGFVAAAATAGLGLFDTVTAGCSASAAAPRNGARCLRVVAPANTIARTRVDAGGTGGFEKSVQRFAVKVSSWPSSGSAVIAHTLGVSALVNYFLSISSTGALTLTAGGASASGPTIDTTNWHVIEIQRDGLLAIIDWKVDGVAQTRVVDPGGTGYSRYFALGTHLATQPAFTAEYDDWIIGTYTDAATDWYGDGKVLAQLPGSVPFATGFNFFSPGDAGTVYDANYTTAYTMVDDPPGTGGWTATRSATDNIALRNAVVTALLGLGPIPTAEAGIANAVRAILSYSSSATQANLAACDAFIAPSAVVELWGLTGGVGKDFSETANQFKGAIVPPPAGGWVAPNVNGVRWRFGGCTAVDISPVPTVQALMLEVDWPIIAAPSTPNKLVSVA